MDIIFLGAGRPAHGCRPASLKKVGLDTTAMDWQLQTFGAALEVQSFKFIGGYQIDEVISNYPELEFTVVPDWAEQSILHTLLRAPLAPVNTLITYTDTIFRENAIARLHASAADISFAVDRRWRLRYSERTPQDVAQAESLRLEDLPCGLHGEAEFTGLLSIKAHVAEHLEQVKSTFEGQNLLDLLRELHARGFSLEAVDVAGEWAEFNSPADIARFVLGTKAETLARLKPLLQQSHIGEQVSFTSAEWRDNPTRWLHRVYALFGKKSLIVRSSAKSEDGFHESHAGGFDSVLNVPGHDPSAIEKAVESVLSSYGSHSLKEDQVLIQEQVELVRFSGVVMTCNLDTGAPYYCFNFDEKSRSTESVTGGRKAELRTIVVARSAPESLQQIEPKLLPVFKAIQELESVLGYGRLDIEFAVDHHGTVHIFQVRPITVDHSAYEVRDGACLESLKADRLRFREAQQGAPFLLGNSDCFSNMSDWNPAEIVGIRPRPLALSLYHRLITEEVWAAGRAEFGYRDVRPHPLITTFSGQPYVDVRASLNSFIPANLSDEHAAELVEAYLHLLRDNPHQHDKIEFGIAFTAWTPTLREEALQRLSPYGVSRDAIESLVENLRELTVRALNRLDADIAPIKALAKRRERVISSHQTAADKAYALLDDCRRLGTLPFTHAARAGFVATSFLKSLKSSGALTDARYDDFMRSINTVAREFQTDKQAFAEGKLTAEHLVARYGHLRPGTYEITTPAYWESPAHYFGGSTSAPLEKPRHFSLKNSESKAIERLLSDLGSDLSAKQFVQYLRVATEARESVKFEFTKNLSRALDMIVELGRELGISRDDLSFMEYPDLERLRLNTAQATSLREELLRRKRRHAVAQLISLPSLILDESEFGAFERPGSEPNFATGKSIVASSWLIETGQPEDLVGKIVLVPQADPGFDWLLGKGIAGLVTMYGGANSHMAIRATEMGLPAAIGVGEKLYENLARLPRIQLDCSNRIIRGAP